jgi:pimeloyl-ACP methyl ester carboxylesterase
VNRFLPASLILIALCAPAHAQPAATQPASADSWLTPAQTPSKPAKPDTKPTTPVTPLKKPVPSPPLASIDLQDRVLFPSDAAPRIASPAPPPGTVVLKREVDQGGKVEAWFVPNHKATDKAPAPLIVLCHGNGEVIDQAGPMVKELQAQGWAVLLPEYRGYGRSAGRPSQDAIRDDLTWFLDQVLKRPDVDPNRVVYIGRSLGGAVAADLATVRKPQALVLLSTFTSVVAMSRQYMIPENLVKYPFRTDHFVKAYDGPILIFHGDHDTVIPVAHGRQLAALAKNAKYVELNCNHNDFPGPSLFNREKFAWELKTFLASVPAKEPAPTK